jgi:N-acetyltransferase
MINLYLSAPQLTPTALEKSRAYLFMLPSRTDATREVIVGALIATRIEEAMRVAKVDDKCENEGLVPIDSGLYCYPEKISAAMGVSRLFVSTVHRRKSVAAALLAAAAKTFIHGCPLRIEDETVAFSQPSESGRKFMESFGKGLIGVFEE